MTEKCPVCNKKKELLSINPNFGNKNYRCSHCKKAYSINTLYINGKKVLWDRKSQKYIEQNLKPKEQSND